MATGLAVVREESIPQDLGSKQPTGCSCLGELQAGVGVGAGHVHMRVKRQSGIPKGAVCVQGWCKVHHNSTEFSQVGMKLKKK